MRRFVVIVFTVVAASLLAASPPAPAQVSPSQPVVPPPIDAPVVGEANSNGASAPGRAAAAEPLVGTFKLTAGKCTNDGASGTWFRMTQPAGGDVDNGDSPCGRKAFTPLKPGSDGGLVTGQYQPHPEPAFDGSGNGRAAKLTEPARFYGVAFSTATNPTDPQTSTKVPAPELTADDSGAISGDLRAFSAAWNNQHFNQGSPKPDGSRPAGTTGPTGTINRSTGAFAVEWSSRISGGPFNNFIGTWHLEGTFTPSGSSAPPSTAPPSPSSPPRSETAAAAAPRPTAPAAVPAATGPTHPRTGGPAGAVAGGLAGVALAVSVIARRLIARASR